jgi:hypothetical protein
VHMIKLTNEREIAPYAWVHPDDDDRRDLAPKFYPAVISLLAFGLPCLAVGATGAGAEPLA